MISSWVSLPLYLPLSLNGSLLALRLTSIMDATRCHFQSVEAVGVLMFGCVIVMSGFVA